MEVKKAIINRRSIRNYLQEEVSEDLINELLNAARLAPSGNNVQPWSFKVIKCQAEKDLLKENKIFMQDFVYTAPVIIICLCNPELYKKSVPGFDFPNDLRAIRDLALASQNLVLRATDLGLGSCYVGWLEKDKIKKILNIPEKYILPYVIAIGYPDENPAPRPRKELNEIIFNPKI